jgi:hypothetical protein
MEQFVKEVMRKAPRPKEFRPIIVDGVDNTWGLDLADMSNLSTDNDGYKFILVVVDIFSRFAWCRLLKTKNATEVWSAFQTILDEQQPKNIWVDKGTEFYNKIWTTKLNNLHIKRYSTFGNAKVSIAERFIRTLKTKLWEQMLQHGSYKWFDIIDEITKEYNETIHSTINMSPQDARKPQNEDKIFHTFHIKSAIGRPKFKLGDWVRISRIKGIFEKSLVADPEFFPIEKKIRERTSNGVRQVLVQFLGYKEPRWIDKNALEIN